ncbi:MAG TPA: NAD-dependent epimerase/dehydratase family protein [Thermoanaerobaculia bacterium]|jgi:CDP-paratose 2-epimerase|nr:NAD-dependent epimerase/dehydratase family protein [Thermoanaerobaculia bacterium]
MSVAIVSGSSGLVGSETAKFLHEQGLDVVGIDNDMRAYFFGADASTTWNTQRLKELPRFTHAPIDIRDEHAIEAVFRQYGKDIALVVHCAAQPSHDWAAREPMTDFTVNANGTLVMLQATRTHAPDAVFLFTSTNKVYGDTPNRLPLIELERRWELPPEHQWGLHGIDETMSIDQTKHSVFGVSKVAADVMVQEYGRYFGMRTAVFRGGCLTGPAHSGAELHGFLAYLIRCAVTGRHYTIYGYKGKQVRDNIHSNDLVQCFWHFFRSPKAGAVYNIGGSRFANCSVLEAIDLIDELSGYRLDYTVTDDARSGDHIWWISDVRRFQSDYPEWQYKHDLRETMREIIEESKVRYAAVRA